MPHLSGYYSKDAIIGLSRLYDANFIIYFSTIVGVISTTFYSIRLFFYLFVKQDFKRKGALKYLYGYKTNYFNVVPLAVLSFMSIFAGYFTKVFFIGLGTILLTVLFLFWAIQK